VTTVNVDSKKVRLIGWTIVFLNILQLPLVINRIKTAGKIEGINPLINPCF